MAVTFNYLQLQQLAHNLIVQFGGKAKLRRTGSADRFCYAVDVDNMPKESTQRPVNPVGRTFLISPKGLTLPPNHEKDGLVTLKDDGTEDEVLRIIEPVGKLQPATAIIYYELSVRG